MKKNVGRILIIISVLFILNAIFGRYLVLPGFFASLETNTTGERIPEGVPVFKIVRYLLWAFSFKFGIYFFILGVLFYKNSKKTERLIFSIVGFMYISFAYMDMPFNYPLYFGIGGGIITIVSLIFLWTMGDDDRSVPPDTSEELFIKKKKQLEMSFVHIFL